MTPAARLAAAIEALAAIDGDRRPADRVLNAFLRARRYIGAKDRHAISGRVYTVLRQRARLDWMIAQKAAAVPLDARGRVLASVVLEGDAATLAAIGTDRHGPPALSHLEQDMVAALTAAPPALTAAPAHVRLEAPAWVMTRLETDLGADAAPLLAAMTEGAAMDLRVNPARADRGGPRHARRPWYDGRTDAAVAARVARRRAPPHRRVAGLQERPEVQDGAARGRRPGRRPAGHANLTLRRRRRQIPGDGRRHGQSRPDSRPRHLGGASQTLWPAVETRRPTTSNRAISPMNATVA